jgi:hypothetical protein
MERLRMEAMAMAGPGGLEWLEPVVCRNFGAKCGPIWMGLGPQGERGQHNGTP